MSIYQSDSDAAPNSEFEPGTLQHLVRGNAGRLLDPRRTQVTIVGLHLETGFMTLRVDSFEDAGVTWDIPFEEVDHYQFAHGFARLGLTQVELWRGISADGLLRLDGGETLLSASFDERVARSHLAPGPGRPTRCLMRGLVPTDRLFMTFLETDPGL